MNSRIAVVPGSFDPPTRGHLDVIRRAARMYDQLHVVVVHNPGKEAMLPLVQRLSLLEQSIAESDIEGDVVVASWSVGLLVDYVRDVGAGILVKGIRSQADVVYELPMAVVNRDLAGARRRQWVNLGGQLVAAEDLEALKAEIRSGRLDFALLKPIDTQFLVSLQRVEWSSLGNFVFGPMPLERQDSAVLELELARGARPVQRAALRPVRLTGARGAPVPAAGRGRASVVRVLREASAPFATRFRERDDGALELEL